MIFARARSRCPVLMAFLAGNEREQAFWKRHHQGTRSAGGRSRPGDATDSRAPCDRYNDDWARRFAHDAKTALKVFPESAIREALVDVADYTVQRVTIVHAVDTSLATDRGTIMLALAKGQRCRLRARRRVVAGNT